MYTIVNQEGELFEENFLTEDEAIDCAGNYFDELIDSDEDFSDAEWTVLREDGRIIVQLSDEDGVVEELEIITA